MSLLDSTVWSVVTSLTSQDGVRFKERHGNKSSLKDRDFIFGLWTHLIELCSGNDVLCFCSSAEVTIRIVTIFSPTAETNLFLHQTARVNTAHVVSYITKWRRADQPVKWLGYRK
jgi:hypothetical protein